VKLTYETAVATFIQFIISSLFILITQFGSAVTGCFKDRTDCVSNIIPSIIFFIVVSVFFGVIWLIGFAAQSRRSRRLAQLLILIEAGIGMLGLFSIKLNLHSHNVSGLVASIGIAILCAWVITLAYRLMRAGGGRVVPRQRRRKNSSGV
jgi:hypothetical protein